jgi:hypothetical protein
MKPATSPQAGAPLQNLEEWEDFLKERYPEPAAANEGFKATDPEKKKQQFRNYEADARPTVREFYRLNHRYQTFDFVQAKRQEFLATKRRKMSIWEALEYLNTLVDDSDPDTDLSQLEHLLQTAGANSTRRPPAVVHPDGPHSRPRKDSLPLRRTAMGRGGRHLPGRLRLFGHDCLPPVLRP